MDLSACQHGESGKPAASGSPPTKENAPLFSSGARTETKETTNTKREEPKTLNNPNSIKAISGPNAND